MATIEGTSNRARMERRISLGNKITSVIFEGLGGRGTIWEMNSIKLRGTSNRARMERRISLEIIAFSLRRPKKATRGSQKGLG